MRDEGPPPTTIEHLSVGIGIDDAIGVLRRRWLLMLVATLVVAGLGAAWIYLWPRDDIYEATAEVVLTRPGQDNGGQFLTQREVGSEAQRAASPDLKARVRAEVGASASLSVGVVDDSDVLRFRATSPNPQVAADAANAYVRLHEASRSELLVRQLDQEIEVLADRVAELDGDDPATVALRSEILRQAEDARTTRAFAVDQRSEVLSAATVPTSPVPDQPRGIIALIGALAVLVGVFVGWARDSLDRRLRSTASVEEASGAPVLATVPRSAAIGAGPMYDTSARELEAYRTLWANLRLASTAEGTPVVAVTSSRPAEGKSTTVVNLALTAARSGQRVLVIDADLRRSRIHDLLGMERSPGLTDLAEVIEQARIGSVSAVGRHVRPPDGTIGDDDPRRNAVTRAMATALSQIAVRPVSDLPTLSVLPAGPPTSAVGSVLSGPVIGQLLSVAHAADYDVILVDTPPLLSVADTLLLAPSLAGVVLVTTPSTSDRREIDQVVRSLDRHRLDLIGVVVNDVDERRSRYGYYRDYPYYEAETEATDRPVTSVARDSADGAGDEAADRWVGAADSVPRPSDVPPPARTGSGDDAVPRPEVDDDVAAADAVANAGQIDGPVDAANEGVDDAANEVADDAANEVADAVVDEAADEVVDEVAEAAPDGVDAAPPDREAATRVIVDPDADERADEPRGVRDHDDSDGESPALTRHRDVTEPAPSAVDGPIVAPSPNVTSRQDVSRQHVSRQHVSPQHVSGQGVSSSGDVADDVDRRNVPAVETGRSGASRPGAPEPDPVRSRDSRRDAEPFGARRSDGPAPDRSRGEGRDREVLHGDVVVDGDGSDRPRPSRRRGRGRLGSDRDGAAPLLGSADEVVPSRSSHRTSPGVGESSGRATTSTSDAGGEAPPRRMAPRREQPLSAGVSPEREVTPPTRAAVARAARSPLEDTAPAAPTRDASHPSTTAATPPGMFEAVGARVGRRAATPEPVADRDPDDVESNEESPTRAGPTERPSVLSGEFVPRPADHDESSAADEPAPRRWVATPRRRGRDSGPSPRV